eukprot:3635568-Pyramimonas_sp.AAC.1
MLFFNTPKDPRCKTTNPHPLLCRSSPRSSFFLFRLLLQLLLLLLVLLLICFRNQEVTCLGMTSVYFKIVARSVKMVLREFGHDWNLEGEI